MEDPAACMPSRSMTMHGGGSFGNCDLDQSNEINCPVYHGVRKLRALEQSQSHPASPAAPGRFGASSAPDGRTTFRDGGILQHGLSHGAHSAVSAADNHRPVPSSGQGQVPVSQPPSSPTPRHYGSVPWQVL
ncbi:hypothetical protein AK812_SmicGene38389 [Symbiodinium microadriaticum]|uniref:Uncharacterized protein n=1 Tax=Symbiodinium microadriaticum TaxID=2951 RepID=A0A1Q9CDU7_SYMMI|nr:hypothetical protein AK812_SmicGene38389 [Symbiodinium microadriaticum]